MTIYLQSDELSGNITTKNYENAIELFDIRLESSRPVTQKIGTSENRSCGSFQIGKLHIVKALDDATITFMQYYFDAKVFREMHISHITAGNNPVQYASETYSNVLVTDYKRISNPSGVVEHIDLSFTKVEVGYAKRNPDGTTQSPRFTGFNLETAARL